MPSKVRVLYRRLSVRVLVDKPAMCQACGGSGQIQLHHFLYAYKTSEVRKNPQLALDNAVWLCFPCHRVADALRVTETNPARVMWILAAVNRYRSNRDPCSGPVS